MSGVTLGTKAIEVLPTSTGESVLLSLDTLKTWLGEHLAKMLQKESSVWVRWQWSRPISQPANLQLPLLATPNSTSTILWRAEPDWKAASKLFKLFAYDRPLWASKCQASMKKHDQGRRGRYSLRCVMSCILLWANGTHSLWDLWGAYIMRFRISYSRDEEESYDAYIL